MKSLLLILFSLALLPLSLLAQDLDKAKLDQYFDSLEKHDKFMGSVAVNKDGKLLYARSLGFADVGNGIKADESTKYRIGSISKTFTAVLVLKAVESGKLRLEQTIAKYFPAIPNAGSITVEHLLRHQSGIHNFTNDEDYLSWHTEAQPEKKMISRIAAIGSDFEPGSKTEYSNSNYVLLTYIVEKAFKKPYATLLKTHITEPAGLKNTYLGGKINTQNHEAQSYTNNGSWEKEAETHSSIPLGAGGIVASATDLVQFSDALFAGKLLQAKSLEKMKTLENDFGMGLFQTPFYEAVGFGHTGGIDGFSSAFSHFEDAKISYALCSNGSQINNNDISIAVLSAVFDKPYDLPVFSDYAVAAEDLDQYIGVYSSAEFPLKVTIARKDNTLTAQATGQPAFPLQATAEHQFSFDRAGVVMEFNPKENTLVLKQSGTAFTLTRE